MFFFKMITLTAIGILAVLWSMKGARKLGYEDFAFDLANPLTYLVLGFCEAMTSAGIFCGIFLLNSLQDKVMGIPIVLSLANKHVVTDMTCAVIAANILLFASVIEGIRIRTYYYEFTVPLRKAHLKFSSNMLSLPSLFRLYRLW